MNVITKEVLNRATVGMRGRISDACQPKGLHYVANSEPLVILSICASYMEIYSLSITSNNSS